jgi:glycosyltransferase involved in cell wall biosynthesis
MLPAVPYNELLDWSSSADIGLIVLPPDYSLSIRFCLPNKFFEYIMAGLPVLSSNLDAIAEMIHYYNVGKILSDFTSATIGEAINTMLANPNELTCMHTNTLAAVKCGLTWEDESRQLVQLYQSICVHYFNARQTRAHRI